MIFPEDFFVTKVVKLNDEEKYFLAVAKILWNGKWAISSITICTVLSTIILLSFSQPKFKVSVPFSVKLEHPYIITQCNYKKACIEKLTDEKISALLTDKWSVKNNLITLITTNTSDVRDYKKEIDELNKTLSEEIYNEALDEIEFITQELESYLDNNSFLFRRFFYAKKIIWTFKNQGEPISFSKISIKEIPSKFAIISGISLIMGLFLGFVTLLSREFLIRIKENWA